jgi:hypothetical protein
MLAELPAPYAQKMLDFCLSHAPDNYVEQWFIIGQNLMLSRRAPGKYEAITTALSISSSELNPLSRITHPFTPGIRIMLAPHAEVAYHLGRSIDDVVDRDAPLPAGFVSIREWLTYLEDHVRTGGIYIQKAPTIDFMLKRTIERFEKSQVPNFDIRNELLRFLASMKTECVRREECIALSQNELWALYLEEFGAPHSIMLAAFGSKTRDHDIPELSLFLGRSYNQQDLQTDLPHGIINIPKEVLAEVGLSSSECVTNPQLVIEHPTIAAWRQREIEECRTLRKNLLQKRLDFVGRKYVQVVMKV